ncbi:glutathione synthase/RimK-type ligase-like ATP-grasp enzyme [Bacillus mesophilus]|uniref:ATP-grasp domain-containing protein n=1 Tax=Bacillus mesophilus TaxID=1808955 RepID=A0A6M0Q941_9BACI|nr:glutathione synthase/RimK-type ligase-like ATP-grasp enzyme [Bacillus mesophilus]NEY72040.1 ATP-grasp domain-containing protein [Bacillus mesophilus]
MKWNKWKKYITLRKNKRVVPHLPKTIRFSSKQKLWNFVKEHQTVIIKPRAGSRGRKIYKITSRESDNVEIHYLSRKNHFTDMDSAHAHLKEEIKKTSSYIVQEYIPLATVQGRPFDIRVIVQKQKHTNKWIVTGKVAKLAGEDFFVTNNRLSKGKVLPVTKAIKASNIYESKRNSKVLVSELERISLLAAKTLEGFYSSNNIFGLDMAIDRDGHIWIIEANLKPLLSHFSKLKNKKMYRKIKKLKRYHSRKKKERDI